MNVFVVRYSNSELQFSNVLAKGYDTLEKAKDAVYNIAYQDALERSADDQINRYTVEVEEHEPFIKRCNVMCLKPGSEDAICLAEYAVAKVNIT